MPEFWGYPVPYALRPLVMRRGMMRTTLSLDFKKGGQDEPLIALDVLGLAFSVHDNIEVGISNYRVGATTPKAGQALVPIILHPPGQKTWGDMPFYMRFEFPDRAEWLAAADLGIVFQANSRVEPFIGFPIRFQPLDYKLAIDFGVEATLLTNELGANVEFPLKFTNSILRRGFFFWSTGLLVQQIGRSGTSGERDDSNLAYPVVRARNQVFIPFGIGGGYTYLPPRAGGVAGAMFDFYIHGGSNPLIYFNAPSGTAQVDLRQTWYLGVGMNVLTKPLLH